MSRIRSVMLATLGMAVTLTVAAPSVAQTFTINVTPVAPGAIGTCISTSETRSSPFDGSGSCTGSQFGSSQGYARADFGSVGAFAQASVSGGGILAIHFASGAFSDTVTFSSVDAASTTADVALNFGLDGMMFGGGIFNLSGIVRIDGTQFLFDISPDASPEIRLGGLSVIDGFIGAPGATNALLRTGTVRVPVNIPVLFEMSLAVRSAQGNSSGSVDFSNSLAIPTDRPAFFLAEGFTANSGSWLVDNHRLVASAVPEPDSWTMMIIGFAAVGITRRRTRAKAIPKVSG